MDQEQKEPTTYELVNETLLDTLVRFGARTRDEERQLRSWIQRANRNYRAVKRGEEAGAPEQLELDLRTPEIDAQPEDGTARDQLEPGLRTPEPDEQVRISFLAQEAGAGPARAGVRADVIGSEAGGGDDEQAPVDVHGGGSGDASDGSTAADDRS